MMLVEVLVVDDIVVVRDDLVEVVFQYVLYFFLSYYDMFDVVWQVVNVYFLVVVCVGVRLWIEVFVVMVLVLVLVYCFYGDVLCGIEIVFWNCI